MTVIVVKGNVIASDSQLTIDDSTRMMCKKLFRVPDGIIGFAGDSGPAFELLHHLRSHSCLEPVKKDEYHREGLMALLLTRKGVFLYGESLSPDHVTGKYFAIGSGADLALGAMDHGATAIEAVRTACRRSVNCGGPARWMKLK